MSGGRLGRYAGLLAVMGVVWLPLAHPGAASAATCPDQAVYYIPPERLSGQQVAYGRDFPPKFTDVFYAGWRQTSATLTLSAATPQAISHPFG